MARRVVMSSVLTGAICTAFAAMAESVTDARSVGPGAALAFVAGFCRYLLGQGFTKGRKA